MTNNAKLIQEEFSFSIPEGKNGAYFFTVQGDATETVTFYKSGKGEVFNSKTAQGTDISRKRATRRGNLIGGDYTCKITSSTGKKVKILQNDWDLNVVINGSPQFKQRVISAACEDYIDNDYNDIFLQIMWWVYND